MNHFISQGLIKKGGKYIYETLDGLHTAEASYSSRRYMFTISVCGMIVHESKTFGPMVYRVEKMEHDYKLRFLRYY